MTTQSNNSTSQGNSRDKDSEDRYDLSILKSLRRIIRAVDIHSRQLKSKHNITTSQLVCLMAIAGYKSLTVASLAKEIHLSASTVVGILDRLEEKKLIVRKRDKIDRRVVKVSVTKMGKEFIKDSPSPLQDRLGSSLSRLSNLEQATISLSLDRIVELMEAEEIDAAPILQTGNIEEFIGK